MPIPFIPYRKEYAEQMRILAALLGGRTTAEPAGQGNPPSPYPRLTGLYQNRPVQIGVIQKPAGQGDDPLGTEKYLAILFESPCSLQMSIEPKGRWWWIRNLLRWRAITTGDDDLDRDYAITSSDIRRARSLLNHKKVRSQLLQLAPFSGLWIRPDHTELHYRITSHQVFLARHLAEALRRLLRLSRLCQNLG